MGRFSELDWQVFDRLLLDGCGLAFEGGRREMIEGRLAARLELLGMRTLTEYGHYLRFHPDRGAETPHFQDLITNCETYFFRERHQLELLTAHVIPSLLGRLGGRPLRLLSAGCSSGEEPYSIAIALGGAGLDRAGISWEIDAVDLSARRIEEAKEGVYDEPSLRACDAATRERYFLRDGGRFLLRPEHRARVRLFTGNIVGEAPQAFWRTYDVIFCRNVLIYFSPPALERALSRFFRCLTPDGHLFLGHSEILSGRGDFEPIRVGEGVVYRKLPGPS